MRFRFGGWRIVIKRGGSVIMEKRTSPYVVKDNQADDYNLTRYAKSMLANAGIWYNGNVYDAITVNALSRVIVVSVP